MIFGTREGEVSRTAFRDGITLLHALSAVWSRDEVVRVDFERRRVALPSFADGLEGCAPSERFQMLGEVVGRDDGEDAGAERFDAWIVEGFRGGVLDGAVHPLGLAVGPRVIGFGEAMLDPVLLADAVEDVAAEHGDDFAVAAQVFREVGEGHAVIGEHGVDRIREGRHDVTEERGTFHLAGTVVEGEDGKLGHSVDGEEHDELALGQGGARSCRCG